ncbi:glutathione S-transferase [Caballeronia sp. SEWSISQ10-4 2]|uniref:glutathione S-transferase family protein n=1 Tax=Caballeronia sp. SEWSISQ10-4 2 TaxID=2937438 RepID=UPI00264AD61A|nr:glutathione S-transferase [Caballeronia sp. SEWSISQ10-4 2]MDN7183630.1 glutathione S-transferase [Caballeronia sp. SEWSISQ10-4 2]
MLTVLGKSTSINVRKVLWTCRELGLAFDNPQWGAGHRSTDDPEFLSLNPVGLVPVLIDGDFVLSESNTIVRYLANAYGADSALLPLAPRERALVEKWMDWQATELNGAWRYAFTSLVRNDPSKQDRALLNESISTWLKMMRILDAQLERTSAFVAGARLTAADIVIGVSVQRWYSTPFARPELPSVRRYFERLGERAGFQEFVGNGVP